MTEEHVHHRHYEVGQVWRMRSGAKMRRKRIEGVRVRVDHLSHCRSLRYCVAVVTVLDPRPPPDPKKRLASHTNDGISVALRDLGQLLSDG